MNALLLAIALARLLPTNATVIEVQRVAPNRELVLWMFVKSTNCPDYWQDEWVSECPGSTRGCYQSGPTRVSLVDTAHHRLVNTIELRDAHEARTTLIGAQSGSSHDSLDIPRRLGKGGPYRVGPDGRPKILLLKDYNGDGDASEFALFDAWSCSDVLTTLIGYSRRRDRVIQYPIRLEWHEGGGKPEVIETHWIEHLFQLVPVRPGYWKYTATYPGAYEDYEIRYDAKNERFVGTCRVREQN